MTIHAPAFTPGTYAALVNDSELREAIICASLVYVSKNLGTFLSFLTEGEDVSEMNLISQEVYDAWIYPIIKKGAERAAPPMSGVGLESLLETLSRLSQDD